MTTTQQPQQPRRGWLRTALRRAARRLGYIQHESVLAHEALFRPAGAAPTGSVGWARESRSAGTKAGDRSRAA